MLSLAMLHLCVGRAEEMKGQPATECSLDADCTSGMCNIFFWDYSSREIDWDYSSREIDDEEQVAPL